MKTIAIDMDNVLADVETHYIDWYERDYGIRIEKEKLLGIPELEAFPDKTAVRKFLFTPGFFRTVPVMPGGIKGVKELMKNYTVYIVSAAMEFPQSLKEKYEWLQEHFPFITWNHIVFCGDKSIIDTDYMIDDHIKNLDRCKGKGLLFTACHNININHYERLNDWKEVVKWFGDVNRQS
jgi:5'(3')-deoxyribonucleotidase